MRQNKEARLSTVDPCYGEEGEEEEEEEEQWQGRGSRRSEEAKDHSCQQKNCGYYFHDYRHHRSHNGRGRG